MAYTFDQIFAADPSNPGNVAANGVVTIFAPGDVTQTPLAIMDTAGNPLPNPVTVNANGYGDAFSHATLDRVAWAGGGFSGFFTSYEGLKDEAVAARAAAEEALGGVPARVSEEVAAVAATGAFKGDPGRDGSNVVPTAEAIAAEIQTPGTAANAALSATVAEQTADKVGKGALVINVKDYGAKGDGVADDAAAIQAAITAASTQVTSSGAGTGRPVFFPAGRYKVMSTIKVPDGVSLIGASGGVWSTSKGESRIFMPAGTGLTLIANADQTAGNSNIEIRHLKLMGAGGSVLEFIAPGTGGMDGVTCRRITITECYITNSAGNGIIFSDVQVSAIKGCYISGVTGNSIWFRSSYDNEISGNQIDTYQDATDTFGGNGIQMDNGGGSLGYSDHNLVFGNFIFLCNNGVRMTHARRNVVSGNRINTCNFGINMQQFGGATNCEQNLITGNMFYDHGYKSGGVGVFIDGTSQHNTVSGNAFTREHSNIAFNYAIQTSSTTAGNVITGNTARGLSIGKSFHNNSSGENTWTNNTVAGNGQRVAAVLSAAGAATFDASLASSFLLTLQANATSSTLINGHQGQRVTISWLQDSTGGRTYVWPTNCRFAGAAPTNTVLNRQTSVSFEKNGTLWMEVGRAVEVG